MSINENILLTPSRMALRKLIVISLPGALLAGVLLVAAVEAWVRAQWDETRGSDAQGLL